MNYTKASRTVALRSARIAADIQALINNREYYQFQYTPLTGPLPGLSFEQQTEDAINDIGNMSYGSYEIATQALTTANQAYNAAQSAIEIANHAETTAQNAQTTANNAATAAANAQTTADNAATAAAAAQTTADNAVTAAANAQTTADNAQNSANSAVETATEAQTTATNAQNDATSALNQLESITPIVEEMRFYDNITDAVDLNEKTEFARELLPGGNTNAPETGPGWLDVDDDFNETYIRQKFMGQASGKTYVRFGTIVPDSSPVTVSAWSEWVEYAISSDLNSTATELTEQINTVASNLSTHEADYTNPHKVTAEQLGLATAYTYKGSVATYAELPTTGQKAGDTYNVETADPDHGIKAGDNVAWTGTEWDILGGNHDLSAYATLAGNNIFAGVNTFNDATIINGATTISGGSLLLNKEGVNSISLGSQTFGNAKIFSTGTNLIYNSGTGASSSHAFYNGDYTVLNINGTQDTASLALAGTMFAQMSVNDNTRLVSLRNIVAPAVDTDAANKKYVDDAVAAGGGGGDVTAAGDNTFTGNNVFENDLRVTSGAVGGVDVGGVLTLGYRGGGVTQSRISSNTNGAITYLCGNGTTHTFAHDNSGGIAGNLVTISGTSVSAKLALANNSATITSNTNDLTISTTQAGSIYLNPTSADTKGRLQLSGSNLHFNGNELQLNKNGDFNGFTDNVAIKFNNNSIINYSNAFKNLTIKAMGDDNILELGVAQGAWNIQLPNNNGDVRIANRLYIGNKNGVGAGVISAENSEKCLYFAGTAENTSYFTPNTNNQIGYSATANCYLINCVVNNPTNLTVNLSSMTFKATIGDTPMMQKTMTFTFAIGATVPTVAWSFPAGATVYYPNGTAPTLTASANNIINVIAWIDDTDGYIIQVCDNVAIPTSA